MEGKIWLDMIVSISDNIVSALGFSTKENLEAVKSGKSGVVLNENLFGLPDNFMVSTINKERLNDEFATISNSKLPYSDFEKASILSIYGCFAEQFSVDLSSERVLFVFSSTKGNIDMLQNPTEKQDDTIYLWYVAKRIAAFFGNKNTPVVVSNACISGGAAQIVALRSLNSLRYDYVVVTGTDILSQFIASGFQVFRSLAPQICRPFDENRNGLNLGEASSTIIYARSQDIKEPNRNQFSLIDGVIRNDANHISAPCRNGEGSFRALKRLFASVKDPKDIAFINSHGTGTPYNDAMEVKSICRMGLNDVPVNSFKGYFGHTLGAAGLLETIISAHCLQEDIVLATKGFENPAEDCPLAVSNKSFFTEKRYFIKMLSGFGGCNSALLFKI